MAQDTLSGSWSGIRFHGPGYMINLHIPREPNNIRINRAYFMKNEFLKRKIYILTRFSYGVFCSHGVWIYTPVN